MKIEQWFEFEYLVLQRQSFLSNDDFLKPVNQEETRVSQC